MFIPLHTTAVNTIFQQASLLKMALKFIYQIIHTNFVICGWATFDRVFNQLGREVQLINKVVVIQ